MLKYMKGMSVVLMFVALLAVAGCGTHEEPKPLVGDGLRSAIVGKKWTVENLFARDVSGELTMEFRSDGTVVAFGGCNQMTGTYTLDGEALTFGPMASTRKACGPVLDEQEFSFQSFLALIDQARLEDDELHLLSKDQGEPIVLTTGGGGGLFW